MRTSEGHIPVFGEPRVRKRPAAAKPAPAPLPGASAPPPGPLPLPGQPVSSSEKWGCGRCRNRLSGCDKCNPYKTAKWAANQADELLPRTPQ